MIYVYHCKPCDMTTEVIKPLSSIDDVEHCEKGHVMERTIAWGGQMKPGDINFKPDYYHAFGKVLTNPSQLKDEIKKERYENGVELVEVGNEKPTLKSPIKPLQHDDAMRDLYRRIRKMNGRTV